MKTIFRLLLIAICLSVPAVRAPAQTTPSAAGTAKVKGPSSTISGAQIYVSVEGPHKEYDIIGIVPASAPEGTSPGHFETYVFDESTVQVTVPEKPGRYEIRYLAGGSGGTLAHDTLTITAASASVKGPGNAMAGATISVSVEGPHNEYDIIGIVPAGAPEGTSPGHFKSYVYDKSTVQVTVPEKPGRYEIRYLAGGSGGTLARDTLTITAASASVKGPGNAMAGATISVSVEGPHNEYDIIGIVSASAPEGTSPRALRELRV